MRFGKNRAVFGRAVVVFAGGNIAAAARNVDLQHLRIVALAALAGQADEIRGHAAAAVIAHRMRRITADRDHGLLSVPEAQGLEPRVDDALGLGTNRRIPSGAHATEAGFAVIAQVAAVGRYLLHLCLADAQVGYPPRLLEAFTKRPSDALHGPFMKIEIADVPLGLGSIEQLLCCQVRDRSVVLM
jgi:hypothetical protein